MKHFKSLGCAIALAAIFMASTGSASATTLTSPSGTEYTGSFTMTATESLLLKAGFANFTCTESTTGGPVTSNGAVGGPAVINTGLSFGNCGSGTLDVIRLPSLYVYTGGKVEVHFMEFTVSTLGTSCVYGVGAGTSVGTMAGGNPATLTVSASLPKVSGGFLCASPASWSGKYTVTTPRPLLID